MTEEWQRLSGRGAEANNYEYSSSDRICNIYGKVYFMIPESN